MEGLTEGRIVHGSNDAGSTGEARPLLWATSIEYSEEPKPRTWHWIEKA